MNGVGALIMGKPGSGKSSLLLGLLDLAHVRGLISEFLSDDQVLIEKKDGTLHAIAPKNISGLIELRHYGIIEISYIERIKVDVIFELAHTRNLPRIREQSFFEYEGIKLPLVLLPRRHEQQAVRIVLTYIESIPLHNT